MLNSQTRQMWVLSDVILKQRLFNPKKRFFNQTLMFHKPQIVPVKVDKRDSFRS